MAGARPPDAAAPRPFFALAQRCAPMSSAGRKPSACSQEITAPRSVPAARMASSSAPERACSMENGPDAVRSRKDMCAGTPSARPISAQSVRTYVPREQRTRSRKRSGAVCSSSVSSKICAVRTRSGTASPARARSYILRPLTLSAEYAGATCSIRPVNAGSAAISLSREIAARARAITVPAASCVSVAAPSASSAI